MERRRVPYPGASADGGARTEERVAWCLEQHGVRYLGSLFSRDRRRMICLYHAPDAEAVRAVNCVSGVPAERVWTASAYGLLAEARTPTGHGLVPPGSFQNAGVEGR